MLSVLGARRSVWPVGEVTINIRIDPSLPVTTRLTVPRVVPALFCTVRPVVRPGNVLLCTAPRARTLFGLAWAMPVGEAFSGPWLLAARVVVVVVTLL